MVECADHMFMSKQAFEKHVRDGVVKKQPPGKYEFDVVRKEILEHLRLVATNRMISQNEGYQELKLRKFTAETKEAEMKTALLEGSQVKVEDVRTRWLSIIERIRTNFLALPSKCSPLLIDGLSLVEKEKIVRDEVNEILGDLTNAE